MLGRVNSESYFLKLKLKSNNLLLYSIYTIVVSLVAQSFDRHSSRENDEKSKKEDIE